VLSGEQSNTSIIVALDGSPAVISKLFRTLHHGENPDVTLQSALSAAGSRSVPRFLGRIGASWEDVGRPEGLAHGDLAFAQEFVAGSRDGWGLALGAASRGEGFDDEAHALGAITADVHATLAQVLPSVEVSSELLAEAADSWEARLVAASEAVPAVAEASARIRAVYARALAASWPAFQRVHGDLHLGQALHEQHRGWVLVDFEGEPLRPMDERDRPDCTLRDVAGMLRSFAYAEGASEGVRVGWSGSARAAFLDGYGPIGDPAVLDAFELDKAVYEALYEVRNRPTWLRIPLRGIEGVLDRIAD
jgi:maltokinase